MVVGIGKNLPVAFIFRTLNDSEENYSVIEKEFLIIVWTTNYLKNFNVLSDHYSLEWLFSFNEPISKLLRKHLKLIRL